VTSIIKKIYRNEYTQTIIAAALIIAIVFGFWYGSQIALNTKIPPALAVVSGSMCIPFDGACDGWSHPFDRTLHIGDIIIIQGVDPKTFNTDYPNSDIIVFHRPDRTGELIVHRIAAVQEVGGKLYFWTKGDGNSQTKWPDPINSGLYDPWYSENSSVPAGAVSQDLIEGKVVMRIPWVGHIAIFMKSILGENNNFVGIPIIVILIVLIILIEFIIPFLRHRKSSTEVKNKTVSEPSNQINLLTLLI
jgi:hypothetical protein